MGVSKTAGILIIGNEVLSGKVPDENSPFLVRELRALGVEVQRILTIPDDVPVIAEAVKDLAKRYDLVFSTGGIGPTPDDVTIGAIAGAFGRPLVRDPFLEGILRAHYGPGVTAAQLRMSEVPEGSRLVGRGSTSFPVIVFQNVYIFPGIPEAVRRKFPWIREEFRDTPYMLRKVFLQCDEGEIAHELQAVLDRYPALLLGSYPILHNPDHTVMLTLESKDAAYVERALQSLLSQLPARAVVRVE